MDVGATKKNEGEDDKDEEGELQQEDEVDQGLLGEYEMQVRVLIA